MINFEFLPFLPLLFQVFKISIEFQLTASIISAILLKSNYSPSQKPLEDEYSCMLGALVQHLLLGFITFWIIVGKVHSALSVVVLVGTNLLLLFVCFLIN